MVAFQKTEDIIESIFGIRNISTSHIEESLAEVNYVHLVSTTKPKDSIENLKECLNC